MVFFHMLKWKDEKTEQNISLQHGLTVLLMEATDLIHVSTKAAQPVVEN